MKTQVVIGVIFLLQAVLAYKDYKEDSDWCIDHHRLNADEIYRVHKGGYLPYYKEDYLTFIECLWRRIRFLNTHGELNLGKIWEMYYNVAHEVYNHRVSANRADAVVKKCKDVDSDTPALRAVNMGNCLKNVRSH